MEQIRAGALTLLITGARVSIHQQYVHDMQIIYVWNLKEVGIIYFTELDDLYVPHIFYIRNA